MLIRWWLAALSCAVVVPHASAAEAPEVARARYLWSQSPQGRMLERILPRSIEPAELPEAAGDGARLTTRYCVQCHYLPNPGMHTADKWNTIVVRMVWRMQGKGNLGQLMKDMMDQVEAPPEADVATLSAYLQKHGQKEMDPAHPALRSEPGKMYSIACTQCHSLPDPQRHTVREWPGVVARMKRHMASYNSVTGDSSLRTIPVLETGEIVRFLQRYARDGTGGK